ncbi:MAG: TetR/AcrR family transcriptional regulator [Dehalococcoidia bacterium]|nr:TetR/AcrR family transcriptional regulator [Dehalococcoidia bacterium]
MTRVNDRYVEARRQEILDAARRVFVEKGYAAATVNDIAAEADVAAGSIYRYFENKSDLIAEVAHGCVSEDMEMWLAAPAPGDTPGAALLALGDSVRDQRQSPDFAEMCILRLESYLAASREPDLRSRVVETLDESVENLAGFIRSAQESGEFDRGVDATAMSHFLHAVGAGIGCMSTVYGASYATDTAWNLLIQFIGTSFTQDLARRVQALVGAVPPPDPGTPTTSSPTEGSNNV